MISTGRNSQSQVYLRIMVTYAFRLGGLIQCLDIYLSPIRTAEAVGNTSGYIRSVSMFISTPGMASDDSVGIYYDIFSIVVMCKYHQVM